MAAKPIADSLPGDIILYDSGNLKLYLVGGRNITF